MKTRIFTLFMALLTIVWSARADEITSMKLTISHNGGDFFEVLFPAEGWQDLDLTDESTTSIRIKSIEVQTSGTVSNVVFNATMYKTEKGLQPDEEWRIFDLPQQGNTWILDFGDEAPDLIDNEMGPSPRTFRFFLQAKDGNGNDIYYNNGGEDYKVLFVKGEGGGVQEQAIKSFSLTINCDGEVFTVPFPASGWPEQRIEGQTKSIKIMRAEVEANLSISYVGFIGTMYDASDGWQHNDDDWRVVDFENQGGGHWVLDMGEGQELVESEWLTKDKTKTFEFFIYADSGEGTPAYRYNNGGQNYKVTFSTGESADWKIKFLEENTAHLNLRVNDQTREYAFDGKGNRNPSDQLGQVSSLVIDGFDLSFYLADGMYWPDVSCQYRVYEEGQEIEGGWNGLALPNACEYGSNPLNFFADKVECDVTNGLKTGRNYVLELHYQVIVNGEYIFLGKRMESSKFRFSYGDSVVPEKGIRNFKLTINCDGEVFTESFPSKGWPQQYVKGQVSSLKILRAEVETDPSMTYLGFCSTIYDTADGWQHDDSAWDWVPFENQGGGYWTLDWGDGREFIESEWLTENKTKTLEFFVDGGDSEGQTYKYSNGLSEQGYDNNYKVTFTTGIDPDGVHLLPASKAKGATYNLAGQRLGKDAKDYKGIVIQNGQKILRK